MKFISAAFLTAAAALLQAYALPAADTHNTLVARTCGYPEIPLYTAFSPSATDHLYTSDANEVEHAVAQLGYNGETIAAYVYNSSDVPFVVPLYRLYSFARTDHYVTTSWPEVQYASQNGYSYEGITAYVYESAECDSVPLYRLFDPNTPDHYFTTNNGSRQVAISQLGYVDEGIAAYVYVGDE